MTPERPAAILDLDGTLVDSNYHHALAWFRALREQEIVIPLWRLHRHVGIGGDRYVAAVAGEEVEQRLGDQLRERWEPLFDALLPEVEPLDGAYALLAQLKERGHKIVLASSAIQPHFDALVDDKLEARELADGWTTSDDVQASKPAPDLVEAALEKAGTRNAVMIGDTPWGLRCRSQGWDSHNQSPNGRILGSRASRRRRRAYSTRQTPSSATSTRHHSGADGLPRR